MIYFSVRVTVKFYKNWVKLHEGLKNHGTRSI